MKKSNEIINHIVQLPSLKKFSQYRCLEIVKSLLPKHFSNAILFMYIKNQILFFALNHPGIKMEFNYKHNLIKSLLKKVQDFNPECKKIQITSVKSFVSNKIERENSIVFDSVTHYKERSSGEFEILAKDEELQRLFDKIKDEIRSHNDA